MCDRIGILSGGKLVALDTTKNLLERIQTKIVYVTTDKKTNIQENTFESLKILETNFCKSLQAFESLGQSFLKNWELLNVRKQTFV